MLSAYFLGLYTVTAAFSALFSPKLLQKQQTQLITLYLSTQLIVINHTAQWNQIDALLWPCAAAQSCRLPPPSGPRQPQHGSFWTLHNKKMLPFLHSLIRTIPCCSFTPLPLSPPISRLCSRAISFSMTANSFFPTWPYAAQISHFGQSQLVWSPRGASIRRQSLTNDLRDPANIEPESGGSESL